MRDVGLRATMTLMTSASDRPPIEPLFAYNERLASWEVACLVRVSAERLGTTTTFDGPLGSA
jgi:hypothetical protein